MDAGSPAPPDTKAVVSGTVLKGRWKLVQKIGQGAFGEIFSGHDQTTLDPIAVKLERWDNKKAVLKMEVAVLKKLQHCQYACRYVSAPPVRRARGRPPAPARRISAEAAGGSSSGSSSDSALARAIHTPATRSAGALRPF